MDLATLVLQKDAGIVKRWFERAIESYPEDTVKFLRKQKDAIANPVGGNIREGLKGLLAALVDALRQGAGEEELPFDADRIRPDLDRIMRIRALQNMTPSESLAFLTGLVDIVRNAVGGQARQPEIARELDAAEKWMGRVLFLAFDVYAACREDLFDVRFREEQSRIHLLLRRAKLIVEREGEGVDLPDLREIGPGGANHQER